MAQEERELLVDPQTGQTYQVEPFLDDVTDFVGDMFGGVGNALGTGVGAMFGMPGLGGMVGGGIDALFGGSDKLHKAGKDAGVPDLPVVPFQGQGSGQPNMTPGLPTSPQMPGGPGQHYTPPGSGPGYGTQFAGGGGLSQQQASWLNGVVKALATSPMLAKALARAFNFVTGHEHHDSFSPTATKLLARELPKSYRHALYQYMSGLKAPMGDANEDVFIALMIAESGYHPEEVCCVNIDDYR